MTKVYEGLCVGGPHDGLFMKQYQPQWKVQVNKKTPAITPYGAGELYPMHTEKAEVFVYKWRPYVPDSTNGVWLPNDWSYDQFMEHLLRAYAEKHLYFTEPVEECLSLKAPPGYYNHLK